MQNWSCPHLFTIHSYLFLIIHKHLTDLVRCLCLKREREVFGKVYQLLLNDFNIAEAASISPM